MDDEQEEQKRKKHLEGMVTHLRDAANTPKKLPSLIIQILSLLFLNRQERTKGDFEIIQSVNEVFEKLIRQKFFFKGKASQVKTEILVWSGMMFLEHEQLRSQAKKCMDILLKIKMNVTTFEELPPNVLVTDAIGHFADKYLCCFRDEVDFGQQCHIIQKIIDAHSDRQSFSYGLCLYVQGTVYLAQNQTSKAQEVLRKSLQILQTTPQHYETMLVYARLGDCYRRSKQFKNAIILYKKAMKAKSEVGATKHSLEAIIGLKSQLFQIVCHIEMEDFSKAKTIWSILNLHYHKNPHMRSFLNADKFRGVNRDDDWANVYQKVSLEMDGNDSHSDREKQAKLQQCSELFEEIMALTVKHDYNKALPLVEKAIALKEEVFDGYKNIPAPDLECLLSKKIECLEEINGEAKDEGTYLEIASLYMESTELVHKDDTDNEIPELFRQAGINFHHAGYYHEAIVAFKRAIFNPVRKGSSFFYKNLHLLGLLYLEIGRITRAQQCLETVSEWYYWNRYENDRHRLQRMKVQMPLAKCHLEKKQLEDAFAIEEIYYESQTYHNDDGSYEKWKIFLLYARKILMREDYRRANRVLEQVYKSRRISEIDQTDDLIICVILCRSCLKVGNKSLLEKVLNRVNKFYTYEQLYHYCVRVPFEFDKEDLRCFLGLLKDRHKNQSVNFNQDEDLLFVNSSYIAKMFQSKSLYM